MQVSFSRSLYGQRTSQWCNVGGGSGRCARPYSTLLSRRPFSGTLSGLLSLTLLPLPRRLIVLQFPPLNRYDRPHQHPFPRLSFPVLYTRPTTTATTPVFLRFRLPYCTATAAAPVLFSISVFQFPQRALSLSLSSVPWKANETFVILSSGNVFKCTYGENGNRGGGSGRVSSIGMEIMRDRLHSKFLHVSLEHMFHVARRRHVG